jgi:AP-3 complex subunit delta-1
MFEKDVLQLIRGLRSHKGQEREYIQSALRECKKEIKSNDMDQKATALLKLVYLEMFGHDMGWASFNVLEVMSSQKYPHKRIGYLAAVQSFRPDTEVLMLAENLLKKDLTSPDKTLIHLPLNAIPHLINSSMANSLLADLLPRLSHSHPAVRKKTIVTLYRLAVVYPETLRPAWPKIKERLLDEDEDPTVTAAIVNVVCELGWRRPQDFLPLAPRLFELLTQGGNNWMAIKIIKLFSQLTPLEPRLVRKLLPPLTNIIKTTPAMSLLYECINGIIQGGIMEVAGGTTEGDEVARLCVSKLRAMLVVQGDPNLRYVALLSFAKITASHADLVADHQDVILECIDDADISIRTRALDLVVDMVNASNLQMVVERLLKQLKTAGKASPVNELENDRAAHEGVIPMADDDDEGTTMSIKKNDNKSDQPPPLPEDYRQSVIERILEMCSRQSYANMDDFEWYIAVLVELVKQCPSTTAGGNTGTQGLPKLTMADAIGDELRNVAVRVKGVRPEAAAAAQSLLLLDNREENFAQATESAQNVLAAAAFIAGEYSAMLPDPAAVLASLVHSSSIQLPTHALASYIQAIPKVFATLTSDEQIPWTESRRAEIVLLVARITHFLEPLNLHPNLEIQERAVEYLDLMRLASEAITAQHVDSNGSHAEPPLLLTQAIPSLFTGMDLNPVAPDAVRNVAAPEGLDLDALINSSLQMILQQADYDTEYDSGEDEVRRFYYEKPSMVKIEAAKAPPTKTPTVTHYLTLRHSSASVQIVENDTVTIHTISIRSATLAHLHHCIASCAPPTVRILMWMRFP